MKKRILTAVLIILTVLTASALSHSSEQYLICSQRIGVESPEIYFEGGEIKSLSELRQGLGHLENLRYADLGSYRVSVNEAKGLESEFPDVKFNFKTYITVYGKNIPTDTEVLDLSDVTFTDDTEFLRSLQYFTNLKTVTLGKSAIPAADRDAVRSLYPETDFDIIAIYDLYGVKVREDASEIDLSCAEIPDDAKLMRSIKLFPELKRITLGDTAIPGADRDSIRKNYPGVDVDIVATYDIFGKTVRDDATALDLRDANIEGDVGEKLKLLPSLTSVDLHGKDFDVFEQLRLAKEFPKIKFGWDVSFSGKKVDSLAEELDLSYAYMPPYADSLAEIFSLLFPNVRYIDMCDCSLDNEYLASLREQLTGVKLVWRIYMGRWSLKTDQVAFSVLIYVYDYRPLTTDDIQVLKYCTDLQALDLGHQWISDISVIGDYLKDLRILILADNNLADLSPLANLPHLHYLEFFVNHVSDLTPLASCTQLVDLNISYNHTLSDITPILHLPKLERLWLEHCNVSYEDCELLKSTYPNATVITEGKGSIDQGWRSHDRYFAMIDMFMNNHYKMSEEFSKYD